MNENSLSYQSEGETIGKVSSYITAFKKDKEIQVDDKDTSLSLPAVFTSDNEKDIYFYYFSKFKQNLNNPELLAKEISQRMSRLYSESFPIPEVLKKVQNYLKSFEEMPKVSEVISVKEDKVVGNSPILQERSYLFKKESEVLKNDKAELCNLISCKFLAFTLKEGNYCLGCSRGPKLCTLEEDMTPRDKMMFELFKEQLGDEVKARKLVILSRSLNQSPITDENPAISENTQDSEEISTPIIKKRGRKKKAPLVLTEG